MGWINCGVAAWKLKSCTSVLEPFSLFFNGMAVKRTNNCGGFFFSLLILQKGETSLRDSWRHCIHISMCPTQTQFWCFTSTISHTGVTHFITEARMLPPLESDCCFLLDKTGSSFSSSSTVPGLLSPSFFLVSHTLRKHWFFINILILCTCTWSWNSHK